jgi:hypothetical protein
MNLTRVQMFALLLSLEAAINYKQIVADMPNEDRTDDQCDTTFERALIDQLRAVLAPDGSDLQYFAEYPTNSLHKSQIQRYFNECIPSADTIPLVDDDPRLTDEFCQRFVNMYYDGGMESADLSDWEEFLIEWWPN